MSVESRQFRHNLIQLEYRHALTAENLSAPDETEGIVALSAAYTRSPQGEIIEGSPENIARIRLSVNLARDLAAKRAGVSMTELTTDHLRQFAPPVILNGETEQLSAMHEIAVALGIPEEKIEEIDCGRRGVGNTKTQFLVMNEDPRFSRARHLTFVSSGYYVARVQRTANMQLAHNINFTVLGVPQTDYSDYNLFRTVRGEVRRIEVYSSRGDITRSAQRSDQN